MDIYILGMPRSASTYSYNVARLALKRRSPKPTVDKVDRTLLTFDKHTLRKAHQEDDETIAKIQSGDGIVVCSIRRPEEAILSWMNTFPDYDLARTIEVYVSWFEMYAKIAPRALTITMENVELHPLESTLAIGRFVCGDYGWWEAVEARWLLGKRRVARLANKVEKRRRPATDIGFTYYDNATLFHRRHISDRSKFDRRTELIRDIRSQLAPWIDQQGDLLQPRAGWQKDTEARNQRHQSK